jgi:hypothetical protein
MMICGRADPLGPVGVSTPGGAGATGIGGEEHATVDPTHKRKKAKDARKPRQETKRFKLAGQPGQF